MAREFHRSGITIAAIAAALVGAIALGGGCGRPRATIEHVTGGRQETVEYDLAAFQLVRGHKVQVVMFRRAAAPVGQADADFEYLFMEIPEKATYGWLRADDVPAYRWVHKGGKDRVWLATAGQIEMRKGDGGRHIHLDFRATMEPVAGTGGGAYVIGGDVKMIEDPVRTQSLITRYGAWLGSILKPTGPATGAPGISKPDGVHDSVQVAP